MSEVRGKSGSGSRNTAVDDDKATTKTAAGAPPAVVVEKQDDGPEKPPTGFAKLIAWVMQLKPVRVFLRFGASGGEIMASGMFGAGYELARRPDAAELTTLRARVELLDYVAQRVLKMSPAERREFDALMKLNEPRKR